MKNETSQNTKDFGKTVKGLQIVSGLFMLAMIVLCIIMLKKYDISVKNLGSIRDMLSNVEGGAVTLAVGMILFTVVKSFALVFPPAVLFALSGLVFESIWVALSVNIAATALSLSLPYYLGRFSGKPMLDSLRKRFPKIQKLDDFAGENDFAFVLIIKVSGILASDLSSLIFGTLNIPYKKYMIAANIGLLPLNILWTLLGAKGDLSNLYSFLYLLPIIAFALITVAGMKVYSKKKAKTAAAAESTAPAETAD